uniref:Uncharacterized protein n=1 Tax=Knipowitschia caucasica TaxID=637954 RepID=A0AAV2J0Y7_KNICA
MQSSPRARTSPSVSGSTPGSLNDLFIPPSPVPNRKSARLASQDAGSVRTFLAARGVVPGSVPSLHDTVTLDDGCRSDLDFWSRLLDRWNGVSFFYDNIIRSSDDLRFYTDAAPSRDSGIQLGSHGPQALLHA